MDAAFKYTQKYGSEAEGVYPYTGKRGDCAYAEGKVVFKNGGFQDVTPNSMSSLLAAVTT